MHNARLTERASFLGQVDVVPHASDRALRVWGQDVSETGMFLQTTQPFRTGDTVSLRFDVDENEVHVRAAEVVWVRKFEPVSVDGAVPGIGLRFLSVDPPARAALRRLARPHNDERDTIVDHAVASVLPAPRLTLPPLTDSIVQKARGARTTQELPGSSRTPAPGLDLSMISLAPFSQPPLAISMPPDDGMLSSEARVFDGLPPSPRAVTLGPTRTARAASIEADDVDVDLFLGWSFQRQSEAPSFIEDPAEACEEERAHAVSGRPPGKEFHERFDDDAPLMMNKSVIEEPSILESVTLPPDDSFTMGSLPPALHDGSLSIRHLPLLEERRAAPTPTPVAARSIGTAAAFLFAGCCAGAVAGLVLHHQQKTPAPVPTTTAAVAAAAAPILPALAPLLPRSVDVAEAGLRAAPTPVVEVVAKVEQVEPAPAKIEPVVEQQKTLASTTKPKPSEPLLASPGRLEIELPAAGTLHSVFALSSPARVVVDLQGARLPAKAIDIDEGGVLQLRFGHPKPGTERVVVVVAGGDKPLQPKARVQGDRLIVTWSW